MWGRKSRTRLKKEGPKIRSEKAERNQDLEKAKKGPYFEGQKEKAMRQGNETGG